MTTSNKTIRTSTLFEERLGTCTIAMCLDKRHLSPKGKEDFMEAVLNTEDIRKQRFTFASSKRKTQTATEAEAQQSGIGDFPHSTLGKRSLQIGIIFLKPHGIALSLHCD